MKLNALQNRKLKKILSVGMALLVMGNAFAVDLSNTPLVTSTATSVRPNMMFVLDDSGSMASDFMPDYVAGEALCRDSSSTNFWNKSGCVNMDPPRFAAQFNGIYYNPLFTYKPPVNADGTIRADQVRVSGGFDLWDQVQTDPFLNPSNTANLANYQDQYYCKLESHNNTDTATLTDSTKCRRNGIAYTTTPTVTAGYNYPDATFKYRKKSGGGTYLLNNGPYYYTLSSVQWCSNTGLTTCQSTKNDTYKYAKYGTLTRFDITSANCTPKCPSGRTYSAEMTNFANWFAYYRTRLNLMKTGVGRSFVNLDDSYRVGFMTIHTTPSDTSRYIPIQNYTSTQKTTWFNKLYSIGTIGSTPLRPALSTAGKMYAGKALTDPVQFSCQKNFTILSTDGFWNGGAGFKLDNSAIGNQDNNLAATPRPKYDGNQLPTTNAGGGTLGGADTLADVAMYYYKTDLRDAGLGNCTGVLGTDVCLNNVPPSKKDTASHQHMTVFTIGLGLDGTLAFRPDYETATTGDFAAIRAGSKTWPTVKNDHATAIDDLWHAAVNGSGVYYSAKNPQALSDGLGDALREVGGRTGAAAAASTSNPQVTTRDNFVFTSNYRTAFWDSVVKRRRIDTITGELSKAVDWEASALLNARATAFSGGDTSKERKIYLFDGGSPNKLKAFTYANLTATQKVLLDIGSWADPSTKLSQWSSLSAPGQTAASAPGALVKYLSGFTNLEDDIGDPNLSFRGRENVLGDIVNAETLYIQQPLQDWQDSGYKAFAYANRDRAPTLYAAANDGMLHAFDGVTGEERWAYIPTMVLPNLYKLADKNYLHQFYVDGTPIAADVKIGGVWKTILVGGLNNGGKGYYALDITDPSAPKALWEFCNVGCSQNDANMGFGYGEAVVTKLTNGNWVVLVTSGYNNADGKGRLYVLDPATGAPVSSIATNCTGANCGIGKFAAWIKDYEDNTAEAVYAGDLDGNVWRFDINDSIAPSGNEATKIAQVGNPPSLVQSITTKPELAKVEGEVVVYVGTGRLLGLSDKADSGLNSMYAISDKWNQPARTGSQLLVRTSGNLVKQTLTAGVSKDGRNVRTNSDNEVNWSSKDGWYIDFPSTGERLFTDPSLSVGTLVFTTNIPTTSDPCSGGGISWLYELDFKTGGSVKTAEKSATGERISSEFLANEFATRPVPVLLPNGKVVELIQINTGDIDTGVNESISSVTVNEMSKGSQFLGRRAGWREIIDDRTD